MSYRKIVLASVLSGLALVGFSVFSRAVPDIPTTLHHDFSATGVVDEVTTLPQGHCRAAIAVYNWLSLSATFPPLETPQQGEWYEVVGAGEACTALSVAAAATDAHVHFRIGRGDGGETWYFSERPGPAQGCGGLELDWVPPPRS